MSYSDPLRLSSIIHNTTKLRTNRPESLVNMKLLISNLSVRKSSLLQCFSDEQLLPEDETNATVGIDFRVPKMEVNSHKIKLIPVYWYVIRCFSYSVSTFPVYLMYHQLGQDWNGTVSYNCFCLLSWSTSHCLKYIKSL